MIFTMQAAMGTFDGIIDTVSAVHPLMPLLGLLKPRGKLVMVGAPEKPLEVPAFSLLGGMHISKANNVIGYTFLVKSPMHGVEIN